MSVHPLHESGVNIDLAQKHLMELDARAAEVVGMHPEDLAQLNYVEHVMAGSIALAGTGETISADRFHVGPEDLTGGGGMKYRYYDDHTAAVSDGIIHAGGMRVKAGVLGETGNRGAKSILSYDFRHHSVLQGAEVMRANARLMYEAGLTEPQYDKPAGDEGTNVYIDEYVLALQALGVPHAFASITGKSDMPARGPATGEGAAIVERMRMAHLGQYESRSAVQGAGFAGAYYAAEAYDPRDERDKQWKIIIQAMGDFAPDGSPATLVTDHPDGLPITREMVDSILLHPSNDPDMTHANVQGNKLLALARKMERAGRSVRIEPMDVLTFPNADRLVPAATSMVIHSGNIGDITIGEWMPIANHAVAEDARAEMVARGITEVPCELVSIGGVGMSFEERRRDLAKIAAEEQGLDFLPDSDDEYRARVRERLARATQQVHTLAEKFGISLDDAARAVSLGNYAIARSMHIDQTIRHLLTSHI